MLTTEKKSLAVQVLTVITLMIGAYSGLMNPIFQAWTGIVAMAATLTLSTFFPSGQIVKGWTTIMWITNVSGVVLQLLNALGNSGLIDVQTINMIMIGINVLIQVFVKDYTVKKAQG